MIHKKTKNSGFTLIELLVVISIIGLLSSVVFAATNAAKKKAQVAVFAQEVKQLQNALELYRADKGYYPIQNDSPIDYWSYGADDNITTPLKNAGFIPKYISRLPNGNSISPDAYIEYANMGGAGAIFSEYPPTEKCAGGPLTGYVLSISNLQDFNIPLPKFSNADGSVYGVGPGYDYTCYCITGN